MRRPNRTVLIPRIVATSKCPLCYPEALEKVCGGCLLPFSVVKFHSNSLCNTCVVRELRYKLRDASIIALCPPTMNATP